MGNMANHSPYSSRPNQNRSRQKVNLKATLDLTSYFDQYKLLTTTAEQNVIDKAVYFDGNPDGKIWLARIQT